MRLTPPRKLSVIGAMRKIADYKTARAQADAAPDIVERARLNLEHDRKTLPLDLKLKEQAVERGEELSFEAEKKSFLAYQTDALKFAQWILEGETDEDKKERSDYANQQMINEHEKHVTSARPGAKKGDLIEPWGPDSIEKLEMIASQLPDKIHKLSAGQSIVTETPMGEFEHKYTATGASPKTAIANFIKNNPNASDKEVADYVRSMQKPPASKPGTQYMLPDRTRVTSFDGGRTYRNEAGKDVKMPFGAEKISTTLTGPDLAMFDAQEKAATQLEEGTSQTQTRGMGEVAESGTGPFAMAAATVDAVLGGLGVDRLFGAKGLFKNTTKNRQVLRTIKQLGKSALMISSRGAIYEQKLLNKLFPDPDKIVTNPRTEAKKFETLRDLLSQEKQFNLKAIVSGVTPKEVSQLRNSNTQIDRLLDLIGTSKKIGGGPQIGVVEDGYEFLGGDPADPKSWKKVKK